MGTRTGRLDNLTDGSFAFAVTLLVIGGAGAPRTFAELKGALGDIPAFAIGFAIVMVFWAGHVRWRQLRGEGDKLSDLLTLLLIFLVLIYIQPLRGMAAATGKWFTGQGGGFGGSGADLFAVYGTGFIAMSVTMAALYTEALRDPELGEAGRRTARGERVIWLILAGTGAVSVAVSATRYGPWAAMAYSTLPISIGLFASRYDWTGARTRR